MLDLIIKKGRIITGRADEEIKEGDIGISKGKIVKIGNLKNELASKEINAENLFICPGFIDINNSADHDFSLFYSPQAENLIRQGVTTVILGNQGVSLAPFLKDSLNNFEKWTDTSKININWQTLEELFKILENKKIGVNIGTLVGWGNIRTELAQGEFRNLLKEELEKGKYLVERSLKEGALGVSFGLNYYHEKMVGIKEICEVSKVAKKYKGYLSFRLRDPEKNFLKSVEEIIEIAELTNLEVEITNFVSKEENKYNFNKALEEIALFNEKNELINFDLSPYDYQVENAFEVLPEWVAIGKRENFFRNLKQEEFRRKILEELKEKKEIYSEAVVMEAGKKWWFTGLSLKEIAKRFNISIEETILRIIELSDSQLLLLVKVLPFENIDQTIKSYHSFISSDSGFADLEISKKRIWTHPKTFANFIKFLKYYSKERDFYSLKEAISKLTYRISQKVGFKDRGLIKENYWADLVIFDLDHLEDSASIFNPFQYPAGIRTVLINGQLAYHKGILAKNGYGQIIKR